MFLGQLGFYYNVYLLFTPRDESISKSSFVHPNLMSKENMESVYKVILKSLKEMSRIRALPNGILVSENYSNFLDETVWEFDIPSLHCLSEIIASNFAEFQEGENFGAYFKRHSARVVLSKYGQNIGCSLNVMDSLVEQLSSWFNFVMCERIFISYAKNYSCSSEGPSCMLFKKEQLDQFLGVKTDFYGKGFAHQVGNFQLGSPANKIQDALTSYTQFVQQEVENLRADTFQFHGIQGYSSMKTILRRRNWEEPFYSGDLTSALAININQASKTQIKKVEEAYETREFEEARSKNIINVKENWK